MYLDLLLNCATVPSSGVLQQHSSQSQVKLCIFKCGKCNLCLHMSLYKFKMKAFDNVDHTLSFLRTTTTTTTTT